MDPYGRLGARANIGHERMVTTDDCDGTGSRLGASKANHGNVRGMGMAPSAGLVAGVAWVPWLPLWLGAANLSDLALVNGMSPEPWIPTGVLAFEQNASHQLLVKDCESSFVNLTLATGLAGRELGSCFLVANHMGIYCVCKKRFWALWQCAWPVGWQYLAGGNGNTIG